MPKKLNQELNFFFSLKFFPTFSWVSGSFLYILGYGTRFYLVISFFMLHYLKYLFLEPRMIDSIEENTNQAKTTGKNNILFTYFSLLLLAGFLYFLSFSIQKYLLSNSFQEESDEEIISLPGDTIVVKKGDNLIKILAEQNLPREEIEEIIKVADQRGISSSLKIGQKITFDYEISVMEDVDEDLSVEVPYLKKITFESGKTDSVKIERSDDIFIAENRQADLSKILAKDSAQIEKGLTSTLKSLGISGKAALEIVGAYSYEVDFQRQIQRGDKVSIVGDKYFNEKGAFSHYGKIHYVSLNLSGKEYNLYNYRYGNKDTFFSEEGISSRKSLLKTPLRVTKISSGYGNRKHPILGFTKMHHGVDFSAPSGTPIFAAGSGTIAKMQWISGYGKAVQVNHDSSTSTFYAHASSFAKNLKVGSKVKQGQIIAYVGSTGRSTSAHLHYEVRINGKSVNPASVKSSPNKELRGKDLADFKKFKNKIKTTYLAVAVEKSSLNNSVID